LCGHNGTSFINYPEGVFLDKIQTEILRVFLLAIHRHLYLLIVLPTFSFLGLRDFYSFALRFLQQQLGEGGVWVKKYLDQRRVR
jgi:hypothetical protein